ncbi:putative nucleotide-binding protein (sugar kinase/HSP70/actin superfamily) [Anaerosolibacter carboniphilus]|uniref:Putative nucleotide-binding protein (Sugar kinase/HSP70/actin superfamily) n=1 Tax=Anaerosolibacter carboniphilus TaxID=1417629 RepID=A0A841KU86_9FIRM|nr:acyl-CoA dehydratase activase-related protein [Anaerosolibacter carboniphilus]MBB6216933.1 putative nucleotide-binding protein (sugar kinase/HSP70/actin superfamily) [Anaerosolibacter carboniphilus]
MTVRVGIPRGLLYYYYGPLWTEFFESLGAEVVISAETNKKIVEMGVKSTVDEACLPVKIYHGHVKDLMDQKVDYIFLPRLMSVYKNEYICPKFCGLPEMVNHSIRNLPTMIQPTIDFRKSKKDLPKIVEAVGAYFTDDRRKIEWAFTKALENYRQYKTALRQGILPTEALEKKDEKNFELLKSSDKVALLGHPYNLYDAFVSMNLVEKLRGHGLQVLTPESMDVKVMNEKAALMDKKMFWSFGRKILGTAFYAMEQQDIQGIIYLSSFGCGLDSVLADIVERRVRRNSDKPFTLLTLDEHTGEAGMDTRIEAFVDMIKWRRNHENNFSAYGQHLHSY